MNRKRRMQFDFVQKTSSLGYDDDDYSHRNVHVSICNVS